MLHGLFWRHECALFEHIPAYLYVLMKRSMTLGLVAILLGCRMSSLSLLFELRIVLSVELDLRHKKPSSDESECIQDRAYDEDDPEAFDVC
jgi:hypothetical protein